jgi:hypothetical protein
MPYDSAVQTSSTGLSIRRTEGTPDQPTITWPRR